VTGRFALRLRQGYNSRPGSRLTWAACPLLVGPMMCANCDGSCGRAGGTKARLGDLTRMLTYHEHHGARVMAREEYAGLTEEERDWHDADLEAARDACHSHLDFAKLLPQVDKFLA